MPRRRDDREQLAYVLRRAEEAKSRDDKRNKLWDKIEERRHRKHALNIPVQAKQLGVEEIKTSFVNRDINTVVGINTEAFPVVHRPPRSTSIKDQDDSSLVETWLNAALVELDGAEDGGRTFVDASDAQAAFGIGAYRLLYKSELWDCDEFDQPTGEADDAYTRRVQEYKEQAPLPIVWQSLDPRTVHPFAKDGKLVEVMIIEKRRRYDVAETYRDVGVSMANLQDGRLRLLNSRISDPYPESGAGGDAGEEIEFVQHWELEPYVDPDTGRKRRQAVVTYTADQTLLEVNETGYPRVPIFIFGGITTSSADPQYKYQSIAENIIDLVPAVDHAFTTRQAWAAFAAFAMGIYTDAPGEQAAMQAGKAADPTVVEYKPWHVQRLPAGAKYEWAQPPPVGRDLVQLPDQLVSLIRDFSSVADILRGRAEPGTPAWLGAQLLSSASRSIGMLPKNHSVALKEVCQLILWLVEHKHKDAMYVEADQSGAEGETTRKLLRLRPEDIAGYYSLTVDLNTLSQDRMIQWGKFLADLQAQGVVSMKRTREEGVQISAPEKEEEDVLFERYTNSDQFNQEVWDGFKRAVYGPPPPEPAPQPSLGTPNGQVPPEQMGGQQQAGGVMEPQPAPGAVPLEGVPSPNPPVPGMGLPVSSPVLTPTPQGQMVG